MLHLCTFERPKHEAGLCSDSPLPFNVESSALLLQFLYGESMIHEWLEPFQKCQTRLRQWMKSSRAPRCAHCPLQHRLMFIMLQINQGRHTNPLYSPPTSGPGGQTHSDRICGSFLFQKFYSHRWVHLQRPTAALAHAGPMINETPHWSEADWCWIHAGLEDFPELIGVDVIVMNEWTADLLCCRPVQFKNQSTEAGRRSCSDIRMTEELLLGKWIPCF